MMNIKKLLLPGLLSLALMAISTNNCKAEKGFISQTSKIIEGFLQIEIAGVKIEEIAFQGMHFALQKLKQSKSEIYEEILKIAGTTKKVLELSIGAYNTVQTLGLLDVLKINQEGRIISKDNLKIISAIIGILEKVSKSKYENLTYLTTLNKLQKEGIATVKHIE